MIGRLLARIAAVAGVLAQPVLLGLIAAIAISTVGCSDPCGQLAARTCKRVGNEDPLCAKLQRIATDPRPGDRKACRAGNAFVDELQRTR